MLPKSPGHPQVSSCQAALPAGARDPEDRLVLPLPECIRDKMLDKTIADSFPTSDPPSTLPDPSADDSFATEEERRLERLLCDGEAEPPKAA